MAAVTASRRAADRLIEEKEPLAQMLTQRLYAAMPELHAKYGEAGRTKCLQDMRYNLEHLAPAVDLGMPAMFGNYVRWLDDLLRARGIATAEVVRTLELMEQLLPERLEPDEAAACTACIHAGLAVLRQADG